MRTNQEIIEEAFEKILNQREIAYGFLGCLYRTESGAGCAIGVLLPDDISAYTLRSFNDSGRLSCFNSESLGEILRWIDTNDKEFLFEMQTRHDRTAITVKRDKLSFDEFIEGLRHEFVTLSLEYGFTPNFTKGQEDENKATDR